MRNQGRRDVYDSYISRIAKYRLEIEETDTTAKETEDETGLEENDLDETSMAEDDILEDRETVSAEDIDTADRKEERSGQKFTKYPEPTIRREIIGDREKETIKDFKKIEIKTKTSPSIKKIKEKLICVVPDYSYGLAQEPWPKDVKLYQPYEVEQILLPDNANCLAVQAFLRMCNLDFEVTCRANAEFMSPSGKVPFIKCGAFVISEFEGIVQFVNNKGITLTGNLEAEEKADIRAYMSLVHNVLENAELYLCWCDKETYNEVTKPRNGSVYPWPLNHFQTWSKKSLVCKRLKIMGWYNKTLENVYQEVENCCQALTDRLEDKEYFFGKTYTEMDALVYGHIYSILTMPLPTEDNRLAYTIYKFDRLMDHCKQIHKLVMHEDGNFVVSTYSTMLIPVDNESATAYDFESDDWKGTVTEDIDMHMEGELENVSSSFVNSESSLPTELDALVFGHLFTILTTPLPNNQIANIVRNYPTLILLVQRIEKSYFKRETKH